MLSFLVLTKLIAEDYNQTFRNDLNKENFKK